MTAVRNVGASKSTPWTVEGTTAPMPSAVPVTR
jgi:hypothetical protein